MAAVATMAVCVSCNSGSSVSQETASPQYKLPEKITVTNVSAIRGENNGTVIEGNTNLPEGTKLGVELLIGKRIAAQDFQIFVASGKFHSAAFSNSSSPLRPGKQKVHILAYFNNNWQSESVLKLVGDGGSHLKQSEVIHSEDPQLIDSDKILDYTLVLTIPPIADVRSKSVSEINPGAGAEQRAIEMVKKAVLTVDGSRSSETIEGGFEFYCTVPGIGVGNGWSAAPLGPNTFRVSLDFIDNVGSRNEHHESAIWDADMSTKRVLYRNKYAKYFSWIPAN